MSRMVLAWILVAGAASQVGCATIFTGTSDKVEIDCDPPGATCAVIGGRGIGGLLVTAAQANVGLRKVLSMVERQVSPEAREKLSKVDFNELVAALVMKTQVDHITAEEAEGAGAIIESLPIPLVKDILEALGIEEIGGAPMRVTLKKGGSWGVLCFKKGYKARIELVGLRFNAVTILNFLNLFIGCGIDLLTGAMFTLKDKVRVRLKPRG